MKAIILFPFRLWHLWRRRALDKRQHDRLVEIIKRIDRDQSYQRPESMVTLLARRRNGK